MTPVEPLEVEESPVFVKAFMFSPEVPIRVDYKGKNLRGMICLTFKCSF